MTSSWMWWQGYVTVRLRGPGLERLLNNMVERDILLQGVQRLTGDVMIIRLKVKDFYRLRPLLWGTQINVSILDKHGAPFFFGRFRLRVFLAVGLMLSLLFVIYLSNFIWFIEVTGNQTLPIEALKATVEELGLRTGVVRSTIEPSTIEGELLKRFPILAWAQVRIKGVKVDIFLTERDGVEQQHAGPGHVYAATDGVVTEILVLRGTAQVRDGSTVRKGDLLISGEYYDARGQKQFGAAQGVVKARVWYEGIGEEALSRWDPLPTGIRHRQYAITIGSITIPIGPSYPRETHLQSEKKWHLSLGRALVPLSLGRIDYHEVEYIKALIPREEAEKKAYDLAWESLLEQGVRKEHVLKERQTVDFMADGDGIRVEVLVEVLDDIGLFLMH